MKKTVIALLSIMCLCVSTAKVYAISDVPATDSYTPSGDSSSGGGGTITCPSSGSGVNWGNSWNVRSIVYADVYDENGKYLGDLLKYDTHNFTAGRFVGIDVYEEYEITVSVTAYPYCFSYVWDCDHCGGLQCVSYNPESENKKTSGHVMQLAQVKGTDGAGGGGGGSSSAGNSSGGNVTATCQHKCKAGGCSAPEVSKQDIINKLNAIIAQKKREASYTAYRHDVNDINITNLIKVDDYEVTTSTEPVVNGLTGTKTIRIKVKYNPQQTCLNRKTAQVTYVKFGEKCDGESMEVKNFTSIRDENDKVGMYFIPLNTKSNHTYTYELQAKSKQIEELCKAYIEKYKDPKDQRWRKLLLGNNKQSMANMNYNQAKKAVKGGCYYAMNFEFKVKQEFYNENSSNRLEGYGFYYRPIDASNPFPNGLGDSTYWGEKGLYNSKENSVTIDKKTYDLDDSFKTVTYTANVNNPTAIREYNKRADSEGRSYLYMSWDNMNVDGSSGFINAGYVTRNGKQSYYKLGCGPSNNTWKECDG